MGGKIASPYFSESGNLLTWSGRDPEYEQKHQKWVATSNKTKREPEKFNGPVLVARD